MSPFFTRSISRIRIARPDWKRTFNTDYVIGNLGLNVRWRFIDSLTDETRPTFDTDKVHYFDVGASYAFTDLFSGSWMGCPHALA